MNRITEMLHDPQSYLANIHPTSFCCNLDQWLEVMNAYQQGTFKYYTTLPTDSLMLWSKHIREAEEYGFDLLYNNCIDLGKQVREILKILGYHSLAADSYASPTVIVCYTPSSSINMVQEMKKYNLQIAGGVPLMLGENFNSPSCTFRIGLFGIDKLMHIPEHIAPLRNALSGIMKQCQTQEHQ